MNVTVINIELIYFFLLIVFNGFRLDVFDGTRGIEGEGEEASALSGCATFLVAVDPFSFSAILFALRFLARSRC